MNIYLKSGETIEGPLPATEARARWRRGELPADAQYAASPEGEWRALADLGDTGRRPWGLMLASALAVLLLGGVVGAVWLAKNYRTPASTEPPPPNVSYSKWEKTSTLFVKIPPTKWEQRLGRNLHRVAYQAATNLVTQTLSRPESARFEPFAKAKVQGVDWRFLVKADYTATNKSGEFHHYDFRAFLKRDSNEVWTLEYLDKDKEDSRKKANP